ncbi:galactokinase [Halobacillus dabanensis]|uniref:Galactokinase n=1 Tax=Halobacillus dabanensis TaxID=240302 RepID=A0A1I3RZI7_HALDA|nr:galactokinase [Halobacillus dabanensis]SFJ50697.1 galactokinase [Halobacillus dabanensis]
MEHLKDAFIRQFGGHGELYSFYAPGRVNLIGEHTDYNGGYVFPCALSVGTYAVARKRDDTKLNLYSMNFDSSGTIATTMQKLQYNPEQKWANYPIGVAAVFQKAGYELGHGFDVAYYGNIPNGAGLSSSASIELTTAVLLNELYSLNLDTVEMVKLAQKAENDFIGVNCGIMDQFAIGFGRKDHAILLNCETLEYRYTPITLEKESLIIINTNKRRGLADSKYNERRTQCETALQELRSVLDINSLGDLTPVKFEQYKHLITDDTVQKRGRHAVYENARTIKAVERLNKGDVKGFGQLMNESHRSLRDDYQVTGKELDTLTEASWEEGAIGSRMTGAGFGGCTISIVPNDIIESFIENVQQKYKQKTGLEASFNIVEIGDGAKMV